MMNLLHICIYYRNPMWRNLIELQLKDINLRVYYYELTQQGLRNFTEDYVDSQPSNNFLFVTPFFILKKLSIASKYIIERYENDHEFDCIHAHTLIQDGYLARQAHKQWGIPYVVTVRASDLGRLVYWGIKKFRNTWIDILENASRIVFISEALKQQLYDKIPQALQYDIESKCTIIPNGIEEYWLEHRNKKTYKTDKKINVITVGRINRNKNQLSVLYALRYLQSQGYDVFYTVVGKPTGMGSKRLISRLRKESFVKVYPHSSKSKLIELYKDANLFVLPSFNETFGLVYAEAMTQGLPVVYSKTGGFYKQFKEGEVGYAVDPHNAKDIAEKIIMALENYEERSTRCMILSEKFRWEDTKTQLHWCYDIASGQGAKQ